MGSLFSQGRVAQRNSDGVRPNYCSPQKVLDEREKAWDRFFDKYVNKKPDDKELNIDTLDETWDQNETDDEDGESNEDSDNGDNDDDDGDDDNNVAEHHKEYNSKRRAPMCIPRTLVQYWIDTGHSPHQLVREDVHAESGSSLSEEEHSRLGKSMVRKESCCKYKPVENSQCSSVDTAAYILSNANVTKKGEMMALVEGSKRCEEIIASKPPRTEKSLIKELRVDMGDKNIPFHFVEQNRSFVEDSHTLHTSISNDTSNVFSKNENSVKLSEVLPALEHLDASQGKLEATDKTPITCSMLSKDRTQEKSAVFELSGQILRSQNNAQTPKRWSENFFENSTKKFLNRRKLYTGRNSPVDLMIGTTQTTTATPAMIRSTRTAATTTMRSRIKGKSKPQRRSHPALEPPSIDDKRRKTLALGCRSRARRKRKRGSQRETGMSYELRGSQDDAVSQENNSSPIDGEHNKAKDKMRYTDFFESLGLTPCKTIMAQGSDERTSKMEDTRLSNDQEKGQGRNWIEEAREELGTAGGEDSMSCRQIQASVAKHLGGKVVRVQLVRLSDKCLARYTRRESQNLTSLKSCRHCSFSCSANEGERVSKSSDIELMNNISRDSDSSTIFICLCNNATEDPDFTGDRSMLATNSLVNEKSSGRAGGLPARIENIESTSIERSNENCKAIKHKVESSEHGKFSDETGKYEELIKSRNVVVRLEKLSLANLSQVTKTRDNLKKAANLDSNGSFEKSDVVETECITVGSRGFHATSKVANEKRWTGSAIDSTAKLSLCSEENDNDYLEKQMVMRGQSIGDIDGSVCHKEEQEQRVSARNGEKSEYTKILGKGAIAKKLRPRLSKKVVCSLRGLRPRVESSMRSPRFKTILDSDIESSPGSVWSTGSRRGSTEKLPERQTENRPRANVDELGKNVSSKWRVLEDSDSGCSLLPLGIKAELKISAKANDRISTRVTPPLPNRKSKRRRNSLKRSFLWVSNGASVGGGEDERGRSVMRKKLRKRNVVEKSIESKSENQVAPTIPFNKSKSSCEKSTSRTNRSASKRLADKNSSDSDDADPNPLKKRQLCTNNIFSKVPLDENGEETRATFEKRGNLYIQKSVVMLESLNLGTTRSRTDRIDQGPSRMRFQTKLDPDSEDDDDADV